MYIITKQAFAVFHVIATTRGGSNKLELAGKYCNGSGLSRWNNRRGPKRGRAIGYEGEEDYRHR